MATIRAYTDISQSKTLSKILPLESADMCYMYLGTEDKEYENIPICAPAMEGDLCAWSLAALLSIFPFYEINNNGVNIQLSVKGKSLITEKGECLLDLAVNMAIYLHELKML